MANFTISMPDQIDLYTETCFECSKLITNNYSTSFSLGIKAFHRRFRYPVYAIYGFVRYADEIVDTFHHHDKAQLIADFRQQTFAALTQGISLNPVLQSFQHTVNKYHIQTDLIDAFLRSMEMDLNKVSHNQDSYAQYIYGSAEVIGLMCLRIFCENNDGLYQTLLPKARSLGAAFQKVNFLRDIKSDFDERGRVYFPDVSFSNFGESDKQKIETDIQTDFDEGFTGLKQLPQGTRQGVYIAYTYYLQLFKKIQNTPANILVQKRIRISDRKKMALYFTATFKQKLNRI